MKNVPYLFLMLILLAASSVSQIIFVYDKPVSTNCLRKENSPTEKCRAYYVYKDGNFFVKETFTKPVNK